MCPDTWGHCSGSLTSTQLFMIDNTFAKIDPLERASVGALLSATTTTQNAREAPHGHCSTCPMPATLCDGDDPAPMEPDGCCDAGHDGARHHVGPVPVGRHRGQLSDCATLFLHRAPVGHPV